MGDRRRLILMNRLVQIKDDSGKSQSQSCSGVGFNIRHTTNLLNTRYGSPAVNHM